MFSEDIQPDAVCRLFIYKLWERYLEATKRISVIYGKELYHLRP